jgi:hypothetical protein
MNYKVKPMEPGLTDEGYWFNAVQPLGEQMVLVTRTAQSHNFPCVHPLGERKSRL